MFTAGWLIVKGFFGGILSKITLRGVLITLAGLAICWGLWTTYNWILERGMAKQAEIDKPIIDNLTGERDKAKAELAEYKAAYEKWVADTKEANRLFAEAQKITVEKLNEELAAAKASSNKKEKVRNEIPLYIDRLSDAACVIPVGAVRLHNFAIEAGETGTSGKLSFSPQEDDGAPSGISLSQFTAVLSSNYDEAVQRGVIIHSWQTWYSETSQQFTEAQRKAAESIPRIPGAEATPTGETPVDATVVPTPEPVEH